MYATASQKGFVWLPAFGPHVLGVFVTVVLANKYFRFQWFYGAVGLTFIAISTAFLPVIGQKVRLTYSCFRFVKRFSK